MLDKCSDPCISNQVGGGGKKLKLKTRDSSKRTRRSAYQSKTTGASSNRELKVTMSPFGVGNVKSMALSPVLSISFGDSPYSVFTLLDLPKSWI